MKERSRSTAYAALAAALGTVLLYLASVLPTGKLVVVCVASLCTVFVQTVCGWKWAVGAFAVRMLGGDNSKYFAKANPNRLVYETLVKEWESRK